MYKTIGTYYSHCPGWIVPIQPGQQSSKKNNKYQLSYTYGCTS